MKINWIRRDFVVRPFKRSNNVLTVSRVYEDGALKWKLIELDDFTLGNAKFKGYARKHEHGEWQVEVPFRVLKGGEERPFSPDLERLCELAFTNFSTLEKELCTLAGVEGSLERRSLLIGFGAIFESDTTTVMFEDFDCIEEDGFAIHHRKLRFYDFPVGDWLLRGEFRKRDWERKWSTGGAKLFRKTKVLHGEVEEECFLTGREFEKEFTAFFKAVQKGNFERAKQVLENLSGLTFPQKLTVNWSYATDDREFYASSDGFKWVSRIGFQRKEGFDREIAQNVQELIKQVKETGNDEDLRSFCEKLVKLITKTNRLRR